MNECDIETSLQLSLYWEGLWPWVDPSWDWLITVLSCDFDPNWVVTFVRDCMSLIGITPVAWFSRWIDKMWVFSFLTDLKIWQVSWYGRSLGIAGTNFLLEGASWVIGSWPWVLSLAVRAELGSSPESRGYSLCNFRWDTSFWTLTSTEM